MSIHSELDALRRQCHEIKGEAAKNAALAHVAGAISHVEAARTWIEQAQQQELARAEERERQRKAAAEAEPTA